MSKNNAQNGIKQFYVKKYLKENVYKLFLLIHFIPNFHKQLNYFLQNTNQ